MRYLRVRNWERFQHYKTGKNAELPPQWIKLHRRLIRNYEFSLLTVGEKGQLMLIWLLAAEMDNRIPADPLWIQRHIDSEEDVDLDKFISLGFLEDCEVPSEGDDDQSREILGQRYIDLREEVEVEKTLVREDADRAVDNSEVQELHDHFNTVRGGRPLKLTTDRKAKYRARLRNYPADDLKRCIDIALADPWLRGANDRSTDFGFPETVLKNDAAVDRWLSLRNQKTPGGVMTPEEFAERRRAREQISPLLEQKAKERAARLTSDEGAT